MPDTIQGYAIRLLIALLVGGVVGLEREFAGKPAGLRTNILMCVGSSLIMIISLEVASHASSIADPGRIAAQVVTGVGFLCAGTIMRSRFSVSGLTTAATIWVLSALGLAIGAGYILLAVAGAVLITITLVGIRYVEAGIHRLNASHIVQVVLENREGAVAGLLREFAKMKVATEVHDVQFSDDAWNVIIEYDTSRKKHSALLRELSGISTVRGVTEIRQDF